MLCRFDYSISSWYGGISKYCNVLKTKLSDLSLIRISCITLTMLISNMWAFWKLTPELSSFVWTMSSTYFKMCVLTTWRRILSDYLFYILIIRGVVILIFKFQWLRPPVLVLFTSTLSKIGIVCLTTSNHFTEIRF